jgi:hypothetical protein
MVCVISGSALKSQLMVGVLFELLRRLPLIRRPMNPLQAPHRFCFWQALDAKLCDEGF